MTTLAELRSSVRSALDEVIPRFWEDTELDTRINDALREIARRSMCLRKVKTYTLFADRPTYDAPSDMIKIYRVEFRQDSNYSYALEYVPFNSMDEFWLASREVAGSQPGMWTFWGTPGTGDSQLYIYPFPSETTNDGLKVYYYALPRKLTEDDDVAEIAVGWEDLVTYHVEYNARRKEAKDNRWQDAKALFEQGVQDMMGNLPSDQETFISSDIFSGFGEW